MAAGLLPDRVSYIVVLFSNTGRNRIPGFVLHWNRSLENQRMDEVRPSLF